MKSSKTLSVLVLVLLSLLLTTFTFAYWAEKVHGADYNFDEDTVTIGVGNDVDTTIEVEKETSRAGKKLLVPENRAIDGQVEKIEFTFKVNWVSNNQAATGTKGILKVKHSADSFTSESKTTSTEILNHAIKYKGKEITDEGIIISADDETMLINVTVTMDEPKTKAEYEEIKNKVIQSTYEFSITITDEN